MGRELRRVPPNWEHPKDEEGYIPLYDRSCEEAWANWQAEFKEWLNGGHDRIIANKYGGEEYYPKNQPYVAFCKWNGRSPDPKLYRPAWRPEDATWYQVYETVSEGTPVTPAFPTAETLIDYLVEYGDFWDQKRGAPPWSRTQAEYFIYETKWAPSSVMDEHGVRPGVRVVT